MATTMVLLLPMYLVVCLTSTLQFVLMHFSYQCNDAYFNGLYSVHLFSLLGAFYYVIKYMHFDSLISSKREFSPGIIFFTSLLR